MLSPSDGNDAFAAAKPLSETDAVEPLAAASYLEEDDSQNESASSSEETIVLCA